MKEIQHREDPERQQHQRRRSRRHSPAGHYQPDVPRSVMTGLFGGVLLGIAYAVSRERADRTLQDPGDAEHYLKIPELGIIPVGKLDEVPLTTRPAEAEPV